MEGELSDEAVVPAPEGGVNVRVRVAESLREG